MNYIVMVNFGDQLKAKRLGLELKIKDISYKTQIDQAIISKIEGGKRMPTLDQLPLLALAYQLSPQAIRKSFLAEKIVQLLEYDTDIASDVISVAEDRIEYLRSNDHLFEPASLSDAIQAKISDITVLQSKWAKHRPLTGIQLQKLEEYFTISYTYESNKIEGNTLSLQETELVVNQGITISGKSMREHLEAINHAEASEYIIDLVKRNVTLDERVLRELHSLILRGIDKENAGVYRQVPVAISGSQHVPPQPYLLAKLMEDYFKFYRESVRKMHPVILAAEMHERLVSIHPFIDGNGRTARLIMNLILLQYGYPIAILKGDIKRRLAYYKALEAVQVGNDVSHFYELVIDEVHSSLQRHLSMVVVE